jgi:CheY-like chemotaxis protein
MTTSGVADCPTAPSSLHDGPIAYYDGACTHCAPEGRLLLLPDPLPLLLRFGAAVSSAIWHQQASRPWTTAQAQSEADVERFGMSQAAGAEQSGPPAIAVATLTQDRTLLIADDDVAFRNRIARALELRGFIVTAVGSVAEALSQTSRSPAFAVLDLRLGDRNGLELVGPLRQARSDIRGICHRRPEIRWR